MEDTFELLLQEWRQQINKRIASISTSQGPAILYEPVDYVLTGGGKRVRPVLVLLSCQAVGGRLEQALDAAVAIELLHNFTLVHDDIMDEDDTRRGRPTVHKKWNPAIAILAGDALYALSYRCLLQTDSPRLREIIELFTEGILTVCEGQAYDLEFEERLTVALPEYLDMIQKKTACLLDISARIGALIGNGSKAEVTALGNFATNLGCAFQIQDDLLDIISDEVTLGKTFGSDVKQRKQTFLLVHALSHADAKSHKELLRLLYGPQTNSQSVSAIRVIFERAGSLTAAREAIKSYLQRAEQSLEVLRPTKYRDCLLQLLNYISARNA